MITNLRGKTALVTGGAVSLGKVSAEKLAASGCNIVLTDINLEKAQEVAAEIAAKYHVDAYALKSDLYSWESTRAMCQKAIEIAGKIDILVASGGATWKYAKFAEQFDPAEDFEGVFKTQMWARLYPIYGLLEHMKENGYGKIVILTSDAGRTPTPREAYVGACASALITTTKVFAKEWARYGIRINALCLTMIDNSYAMEQTMADKKKEDVFGKVFKRAAFGVPDLEDVGESVLFYASPETDKITGTASSLNGGLSFPD